MNEFHKHIAKKFYPNVDIDEATVGEARRFIEIIEYICKAQRNACARICNKAESFDELINGITDAEITKEDYE